VGVVSPVGDMVVDLFAGLCAGRSGIRPVPAQLYQGPSALVAGLVEFTPAAYWPPHESSGYDRATQFALVAARQAIAQAGLELDTGDSCAAGVYWGTGLGGATSIEDSYRQRFIGNGRIRPSSVVLGMSNAAAGQISIAEGLRGPLLTISTACSSSAAAVGEAYRAIKHGFADVIVAGGSEALVTDGN